jgi:hypothetical protein
VHGFEFKDKSKRTELLVESLKYVVMVACNNKQFVGNKLPWDKVVFIYPPTEADLAGGPIGAVLKKSIYWAVHECKPSNIYHFDIYLCDKGIKEGVDCTPKNIELNITSSDIHVAHEMAGKPASY